MRLDPHLLVASLSSVAPGAIIGWGDTYAICIVSEGDTQQQRSIIRYDHAARAFKQEGGTGLDVITFGADFVISPDLDSFESNLPVEPSATLYFLENAPTLVLSVAHSMRFVNLSTGRMYSRTGWPLVGGFRAWRASISIGGNLVPLIDVSRRCGVDSGDLGPLEPEV